MNLAEFKEKLLLIGLENHFEQFCEMAKPTVRLCPLPAEDYAIPIGKTKIGGMPDLPPTINWPTEQNTTGAVKESQSFQLIGDDIEYLRSLSFIAQINLGDLWERSQDHGLPSQGMLYFFYDRSQSSWGFDPRDADKFSVIFYDGDLSLLARAECPMDIDHEAKFSPSKVEFRLETSIPSYPNPIYDQLDDEEADKLFGLFEGEEITKLFGHPNVIQNPMELECELVTNGLYCGDGTGYGDPRAKLLAKNTKDWQLLFQLDSHEDNGMMWGDCGRLYFWLKKQDLQRRQFGHSWCVLQCY